MVRANARVPFQKWITTFVADNACTLENKADFTTICSKYRGSFVRQLSRTIGHLTPTSSSSLVVQWETQAAQEVALYSPIPGVPVGSTQPGRQVLGCMISLPTNARTKTNFKPSKSLMRASMSEEKEMLRAACGARMRTVSSSTTVTIVRHSCVLDMRSKGPSIPYATVPLLAN